MLWRGNAQCEAGHQQWLVSHEPGSAVRMLLHPHLSAAAAAADLRLTEVTSLRTPSHSCAYRTAVHAIS